MYACMVYWFWRSQDIRMLTDDVTRTLQNTFGNVRIALVAIVAPAHWLPAASATSKIRTAHARIECKQKHATFALYFKCMTQYYSTAT